MSFIESVAKTILFSNAKSINSLVAMPDTRFKPYAKKIQAKYYAAKARFERIDTDHPNYHSLLLSYEHEHLRWSNMKKASAKRKNK